MHITPDLTPAASEQELLERYAALAYDRQNDLAEAIGDNNWQFDMNAGTITFGSALVMPVQLLGTFSHQSESWLWAWANEQSGIPARLLEQAEQLRSYGQQHGIERLTTPSFPATDMDLHAIGSIAAGMFDASGYYLADYGQGILVVTIKGEQVDRLRKNDFARVLSTFPQVISLFEMHHRPALLHYLRQKGYTLTETTDAVTATDGVATLTATFDHLGRLANLKGNSGAAQ